MVHRYRTSSFAVDLVWISAALVICATAVYAGVVDGPLGIALPFFAGLIFVAWYGFFRHIREIRLSDGGVSEFRTLLRPRRIEVRRIIAVRLMATAETPTMIVQHEGGEIRVSPLVDDVEDLVSRLVAMNPGIEVDQILLRPEFGVGEWDE
jgi:hypothetical protein